MGKGHLVILLVGLLVGAPFVPFGQERDAPDSETPAVNSIRASTPPAMPDITHALQSTAPSFVENRGQVTDPDVRFYAQGDPLSVGLAPWGAVFTLLGPTQGRGDAVREGGARRATSFSMVFEGARDIEPCGEAPLSHATNVFKGSDPARWVRGAMSFADVVYEGLYPGIDLRFYFKAGMLKYDLSVAAGVDPTCIMLRYDGVTSLGLDPERGDLLIGTPLGEVRDARPVASQLLPDGERQLAVEYRLEPGNRLSFALCRGIAEDGPITIDPGLEFSTYFGGANYDHETSLAVDQQGNIFIGGETWSVDLPTTPGAFCETDNNNSDVMFDAFVAKFDPNGTKLLFCTYIGGLSLDHMRAFEVADDGDLFCVGFTRSIYGTGFPLVNTIPQPGAIGSQSTGAGCRNGGILVSPADAFLIKLSADGASLKLSTLLGGKHNDEAHSLELLDDGSIVILGTTQSDDYPTTPGAYCRTRAGHELDNELFLAKVNASLDKYDFSTYLGGSDNDGGFLDDSDNRFRPDFDVMPNGDFVVVSGTNSSDFPMTAGSYRTTRYNTSEADVDLIVAIIDPTGSRLLRSTYFGGERHDVVNSVIAAPNGTIYIGGWTDSPGYPVTPDALNATFCGFRSGFLARLDGTLSTVEYCTYFGSPGVYNNLNAMTMGPGNTSLYMQFNSDNPNLRTTDGAFERELTGEMDCYIMVLSLADYSLVYGTYYGGSLDDFGDNRAVKDIRADANGMLYLVGLTSSTDLPITQGAFCDRHCGGSLDVFLVKLDPRPCSLPPAPANFKATPGDRTVNLTWDPLGCKGTPVRKYYVYWGTTPTDLGNRIGPITNSDRHYEHSGVENGRTYYYQVSAENYMGEGPMTNVVMARPLGVPDRPGNFIAWNDNGTIRLTWTAPAYTGAELLGYNLERTDQAGTVHTVVIGPEATSYDDKNVSIGVRYSYTIRGYNSLWNGGWSDPPQQVTPRTVPSEPRELIAFARDGAVDLSWRPPLSDGASAIISYRIYSGPMEERLQFLDTAPRDARSYTVQGLTNGVVYYFCVRAFNAIGDSPRSVVVEAMPRGVPTEPLGLAAVGEDGQVRLSWSAPRNNGGYPVNAYRVYAGDGPTDLDLLATTDGAREHVHAGLANGATYYYQVSAVNALGEGPRTTVVEASPHGPPGPVANATLEEGFRFIRLTWHPPTDTAGMEVLKYIIYRGRTAVHLEMLLEVSPDRTTYQDFTVVVGTTYHYGIVAVTLAGEGRLGPALSGSAYDVPGAPTDVVATPGDGGVTLQWDPPASDGGRPVTGYTVFRGEGGEPLLLLVELGPLETYTDKEVMNGKSYTYMVRSVNVAGMGNGSEPVTAVPEKAISAPGAPLSLALGVKGGRVELTWRPPASDGGSPVTGYLILRGTDPGNMSVVAEVGPVLAYADDVPEVGRTYYYTVVARNAAGQGERYSPTTEVKVPAKGHAGSPGLTTAVALTALCMVAVHLSRRGRG